MATQTYPRKLDYLLLSQLAGLGASLSKFAADVRIQSSPGFGEMFEPFGEKQVGSSAMPFKRNPVMAERIDSLARLLPAYADVAWQNAATNLLERTLDDSANRRTILPEALLCADEIIALAQKIVDRAAHRRAPHRREPADVRTVQRDRSGADGGGARRRRPSAAARGDPRERDDARTQRSAAASRIRSRGCSPTTSASSQFVDPAEVRAQLDPTGHVGDAPIRARRLAARISATIGATP